MAKRADTGSKKMLSGSMIPATPEAEVGGSTVHGLPGLHSEKKAHLGKSARLSLAMENGGLGSTSVVNHLIIVHEAPALITSATGNEKGGGEERGGRRQQSQRSFMLRVLRLHCHFMSEARSCLPSKLNFMPRPPTQVKRRKVYFSC